MKRQLILLRLFFYLLLGGVRKLPGLLWLSWRDPARAEAHLLEMAANWSRNAVKKIGARVVVEGADKVPEDGAVLYVANHQGALDIPLLNGYLPGAPAFLAKKELFNIPVLGYWMRRISCVAINRESPREARKAIVMAADNIQHGRRMVLFPEGTRSRDPDGRMAPFKRGSLKLALMAKAVVVPVTVEGSRYLLSAAPREHGEPGEVRVILGDPLDVTALSEEEVKALAETLHRQIDRTRAANHMGTIPKELIAP